MAITINTKMGGFKKWADIHQPTKVDKAHNGANEGDVIVAATVDQGGKTPDQPPHRPWLVPAAGTL